MDSTKIQLFLIKVCFFSSILGLILAWSAESIFGIKPCSLCLYQRYLLIIIAFMAGSGAYALPQRLIKPMLLIIGSCFLIAALLALYHVGLEENWIEDIGICGTSSQGNSLESLRRQLLDQDYVSCSQASWRLFGLSFAGYNFGFSILMAFLCFCCRFRFFTRKG